MTLMLTAKKPTWAQDICVEVEDLRFVVTMKDGGIEFARVGGGGNYVLREPLIDVLAAILESFATTAADSDEAHALVGRLGKLLTGVAEAFRGPQPPATMWGWSDLPKLAREAVAPRMAPVQVERGEVFPARIPWHFAERAWGVYAAHGHGDQSLERLCERGGFGVGELAMLLHGRYGFSRVSATPEEIAKVRDEIEAHTSGVARLTRERDEARAARAHAEDLMFEAREERDEARAESTRLREAHEASVAGTKAALDVLMKERSDAIAACDKAVAEWDAHECEEVAASALDAQADAEERMFEAQAERDEARAEAERLTRERDEAVADRETMHNLVGVDGAEAVLRLARERDAAIARADAAEALALSRCDCGLAQDKIDRALALLADAQAWRDQQALLSTFDAEKATQEWRESGLVRYAWHDAQGRRCTSFVPPVLLAAVEVARGDMRVREAQAAYMNASTAAAQSPPEMSVTMEARCRDALRVVNEEKRRRNAALDVFIALDAPPTPEAEP